jgi:hypothetical protein
MIDFSSLNKSALQSILNPYYQGNNQGIPEEYAIYSKSRGIPIPKDSRGIPWESIENSFLFPGIFFAEKVELLKNSPGIPCGTKVVHK